MQKKEDNKITKKVYSVFGIYNKTRRTNLIYQNYSRNGPSIFITIFSYLQMHDHC
jgi:hypothetical protein